MKTEEYEEHIDSENKCISTITLWNVRCEIKDKSVRLIENISLTFTAFPASHHFIQKIELFLHSVRHESQTQKLSSIQMFLCQTDQFYLCYSELFSNLDM